MIRLRKPGKWWLLLGIPLLLALAAIPAGSIYYAAAGGKACTRCHETRSAYNRWMASTHRSVECKECHGSLFSTDPGFHLNNVRQLWAHVSGRVPERLLLRQQDINRGMNARCGNCHQQEYAAWTAGPHHTSYARIFLDPKHNQNLVLSDHCLLCHGMFFESGIRDMVQPVALKGPWRLTSSSAKAGEPSIPCMACHAVHQPGVPMSMRAGIQGATNKPPVCLPSLGLYNRREQLSTGAEALPIPAMFDGTRPVRVSGDVRQTLCYQCHAPDHTFQAGSGDDRTCRGVHEGLSCLACHAGHDQDARASCVQCHPRFSNCRLDVETMDTTFKSSASAHNIHSVKCADCHPAGVPPAKIATASQDRNPKL